tara:strand:- start:1308 stop:2288 length:981 start_codon:yes stop_codon:yes gene_type:complete
MKAPKLLENESATSFKRRVKAWEQRTGQKYPRSRFGKSDEERILDGAITTTSRLDQKKDYSKDYDLDQVAKEEALSPSYYQEYIQSKEGKEFSESEAAIQEGIETDRREDQLLQISQEGVTLPEAAQNREEEQQVENTGVLTDSDEVNQATLQEKMAGIQTAIKDYYTAKGAAHGQKVLDKVGGQEYTTNFREAFRNANKTQVYADTMESGSPLEKSNVFSQAAMDWGQYKQGDTLGVMTRNQRRAYDEAVSAMNEQKLADEATGGSGVYGEKGKETLTEWTTDQGANEKGKVLATDAQESTKNVIEETSDILKEKELEKGIKMGG